jgi:hypothetical protein
MASLQSGGLITAGRMMYSVLYNASIPMTGILVFVLVLVATTAGDRYWQARS